MRGKDIALAIGLVVLVVLLFGLLGGGMMGYGQGGAWGGWMGPGMMGGYGLGGGILMPLFWPLVIGGIVLLVLRFLGSSPATTMSGAPGTGDRVLDILRERYARGEISKEQFDQIREDLD